MPNPTLLRAQAIVDRFVSNLRNRTRRSYRALFLADDGTPTPDGGVVLDDLARFCRARETCFDPDPRVAALLEGRREVWLRLNEFLHLPESAFLHLDPGKPNLNDGDEDDDYGR